MIKVYNKSTDYLRIDGKILAPFGSKEFDSRTSQIRVLERNGSVTVSEILSNNVKPQTQLTGNTEIKEETVEVITNEVETEKVEEVVTVESEPESEPETEEVIPEEIKEEEVEKEETVEVEVEEKKPSKKSTKKTSSKKKGGNK